MKEAEAVRSCRSFLQQGRYGDFPPAKIARLGMHSHTGGSGRSSAVAMARPRVLLQPHLIDESLAQWIIHMSTDTDISPLAL